MCSSPFASIAPDRQKPPLHSTCLAFTCPLGRCSLSSTYRRLSLFTPCTNTPALLLHKPAQNWGGYRGISLKQCLHGTMNHSRHHPVSPPGNIANTVHSCPEQQSHVVQHWLGREARNNHFFHGLQLYTMHLFITPELVASCPLHIPTARRASPEA